MHVHVHRHLPLPLPLTQVWMALDADDSGSISGGEFGHFMRLAHRHEGHPPKSLTLTLP